MDSFDVLALVAPYVHCVADVLACRAVSRKLKRVVEDRVVRVDLSAWFPPVEGAAKDVDGAYQKKTALHEARFGSTHLLRPTLALFSLLPNIRFVQLEECTVGRDPLLQLNIGMVAGKVRLMPACAVPNELSSFCQSMDAMNAALANAPANIVPLGGVSFLRCELENGAGCACCYSRYNKFSVHVWRRWNALADPTDHLCIDLTGSKAVTVPFLVDGLLWYCGDLKRRARLQTHDAVLARDERVLKAFCCVQLGDAIVQRKCDSE